MSTPAVRTATAEARPVRLVEQLETTRSGMRRYQWASGLVWTALAVLGLACVLVWADWSWVLDTATRGLGLLALIVLAAFVLERRALRPRRSFGRTEAAEEVEATFPVLGQRVRTTLEYAEPTPTTAPAAPSLVRALEHDTEHRTRHIDFEDLVPWRALRWSAIGLAGLALGAAVGLVRDPELRIAAGRLVLLPFQYTTLEVKPGDQSLKEGNDLTVEAIVSGRPVKRVVLQHRRASSQDPWTEVRLGTSPGEASTPQLGSLTSTLKDCRDDREYRVIAGPVESATYRLRIAHPLVVKKRVATIESPTYTRKEKSTTKEGDFTVIEGSVVQFLFKLDRPPSSAKLIVTEPLKTSELRTVALNVQGNYLVGTLGPLDRSVEYQVWARASDGMELEPHAFKIRVQADGKPSIAFLKPSESLAVIATAEVPMQVEARDDFGVARMGIVYQVGDGPKKELRLNSFKDQPLSAQLRKTLALEDLPIDYQTGITYYAFVEDNHPSPPHRTTTDLRYLDIIPFEQSFQMKEGKPCSGNCLSLEELIGRQRQNLGRTFAQAEEPKVDRETTDRLAKAEKALAATTEEFTHALESAFGPVPALHEALAAMQAATEALARPDLPNALPAEEKALAGLIKARKNLRKLLTDQSSASLCRKIDMNQNIKVRRPPPKLADERKQQLARDLKALAREERQISAACQNGSKDSQGASPQSSLADRQEKAAESARQIEKTLREDEAMTALARDRMEEAAGSVQQGAEALRQDRKDEAAEKTGTAADQLERLAEQVEGLRAREIAAKVARARDLAQRLAREEMNLGQRLVQQSDPGQARSEAVPQRGRAEGARTLADWLKRFQTEAADESRALSQALGQAGRADPPQEIADDLRHSADALDAGQTDVAARDARQSADRLAALAQDLDAAHRAFAQPQLDQLVAAEKQAAKTQHAIRSAHDDAGKAQAEKSVAELLTTMEGLKARSADGRINRATTRLAENLQNPGTGWSRPATPPKSPVLVPPPAYSEGVQAVLTALQSEIQEIVLRDALSNPDEAVPPRYKALVEDYYRVLSEDLR
jgi:hypothetical protein